MASSYARFDMKRYRGVLPYASELFGVYQPLLGWKSRRHERRLGAAKGTHLTVVERMGRSFGGAIGIYGHEDYIGLEDFQPSDARLGIVAAQSLLLTALRKELADRRVAHAQDLDEGLMFDLLSEAKLTEQLRGPVVDALNAQIDISLTASRSTDFGRHLFGFEQARSVLESEAGIASALVYLRDHGRFDELRRALVPAPRGEDLDSLLNDTDLDNPLASLFPDQPSGIDTLDPNSDLTRVALSPIGVVHLFRQYFFELDTFLGTPVGHVWLSPGTTLELIEVSTRRAVTEKIVEQSTETTRKTEQSTTDQDEMSEAVKQDNEQNLKFGSSVTASYATVSASANFDMGNTQRLARETTHKHMRQQSEKLSAEIRQSYKSTFRTTTEVTDTTSKRYVISNNSADKLINYELRRKMRQVAVQVQDVGTYLCWQTYVDHPGDDLDTATLVHVAQPADLDSIKHPDKPAALNPIGKSYPVTFEYENVSDSDERDVVFYQGSDRESWPDHNDQIVWERDYVLDVPEVGYTLESGSLQVESNHSDICSARISLQSTSPARVRVSLDQVNFADQGSVKLTVKATWNPPAQDLTEYNKKLLEYTQARQRAQEEAYYKAVRERIEQASRIRPRPAKELREEERIVVYRRMIQDMLTPKAFLQGSSPYVPSTPENWHVLSELISSIFDVDKMLYFVAPEWWKPARSKVSQRLGTHPGASAVGAVSVTNSTGWDLNDPADRDHYFITEASDQARLGSSLGWVLQLDGDNSRNAFLNAPWVKAVIPIRPGREKAAMNWLQKLEGMNGIGPTDLYNGLGVDDDGKPLDGLPLLDVLNRLAESVARKHAASVTTKKFSLSDPQLPADPDSTVTATPVDRVWEHGFNPLGDGFQAQPLGGTPDARDFEVYDQWVEILPTDQVVPVPVEYDPKTGRLLDKP